MKPYARVPAAPKHLITRQHAADGSAFAGRYVLDILKRAILLLRIPLSLLLFLWMLVFLFSVMTHTLQRAVRPLCFIPGLRSASLCAPPTSTVPFVGPGPAKWADFPSLVDLQSTTLAQLLDESTSGAALATQIKKAEMATSDLVTLVGVSDLRSRDMLENTLRGFVNDARATGRALNKLSAKVAGAVDGSVSIFLERRWTTLTSYSIMAVNDYALHTIEASQQQRPSLWNFWNRLSPWKDHTTGIVLDTFETSLDYLSSTLQRLVVEVELNMWNLNNLEEQLSVIHEIVTRENLSLSSAKAELLGDLWTVLGGNRKTLRGYQEHLDLLKGLGQYRQQALVHVVSAFQALIQMSDDIEDLRERVSAPELTGSRIPVHVHIKSIRTGLERIQDSRVDAKAKESQAVRRLLGA
ncbi:unnamed protein product [Mycena citricolor]|uniref:Uncharacterized protein n=1 Tax=Mycena citricolor TaxID=2018698 RepID=A0AAD2HLF2_9AGAR|nr:unnamed protein product [Mycena citricolor]CAK5284659.1 unnamed protein product [Mycena citricolor]